MGSPLVREVEAASFFRSNQKGIGKDGFDNISEEDRLEVPDAHPDAYWLSPIYKSEVKTIWILLPTIRPRVLYLVGDQTVYAFDGLHEQRAERTGSGFGGNGGPKSGGTVSRTIAGGGHCIPMGEHVGVVAKEAADWIAAEKQRWEQGVLKQKMKWEQKSVESRQVECSLVIHGLGFCKGNPDHI
jgi:hypothetical protein